MSTQPTARARGVMDDPDYLRDILAWDNTGSHSTVIQDLWLATPSQAAVPAEADRESATETVFAVQFDFIHEAEDTHSQLRPQNVSLLLLDYLAQEDNRQTFILVCEGTAWSNRQPEELLHAIDLALSLELSSLAMSLAKKGAELFPRHNRIQQAANVLAPPVIHTEPSQDMGGLEESKEWLKQHSREYRGQWVAIRDGRLLQSANSLKELKPLVGQGDEAKRTLVTKVL